MGTQKLNKKVPHVDQKLKKVPNGNFSLKMATHVEVNGNKLREWIRLHCKNARCVKLS